MFLYDSSIYGLTYFKKDGVSDSLNSDAISQKVKLDGKEFHAAATDKLIISNQNFKGINLGLVNIKKFDLKLDKVISKITVTDSKGNTKVNNCKDSKFAKVDLNSKTINGANVVIEYKITVTNEGDIPAFAKKIVDYLPTDMKFLSNLNQDWYLSQDGNAYNASLANTLLQPGESKHLSLILTKQMSKENTGLINNSAEIFEAYNDFGINDIDSVPSNFVQNEDDISSADAMLGIKTGELYFYLVITFITITILGIGIFFIIKKVLGKEVNFYA